MLPGAFELDAIIANFVYYGKTQFGLFSCSDWNVSTWGDTWKFTLEFSQTHNIGNNANVASEALLPENNKNQMTKCCHQWG